MPVCADYLVADAVWPNRSAAGGGGFRARRFTSICEITETIGARMDSEAPRLRLGNEDLQSVSTDAKREESRKSREANEKPPRSFREVSRQRSEGAAVSEEWAQPLTGKAKRLADLKPFRREPVCGGPCCVGTS